MAETVITPTAIPALYDNVGLAPTPTALDNANGNKFLASDDLLVVIENTDSGSHNVQFTSVAVLPFNRTGDITQAVAAGVKRYFRFTKTGWSNGGYIFMPSGQSAFLKATVIPLA